MKRFLKTHAKRFLPNGLKRWLRQRIARPLPGNPDAMLTVTKEGEALQCSLDGKWRFLAPLECVHELEDFRTSPDGVDELSGIARWGAALSQAKGGKAVLFDVGAHAGLVSTLFCALTEGNRAYGFEPSPHLASRFEEIRQLNGFAERMIFQPVGIGGGPGEIEMLIDSEGGFVQIAHFSHSMWGRPEVIRIPVETLGASAARLGIVPDCVKIDIEGYEFEALKGASAFLSEHRPLLFFELHLDYLDQRGLSPKEVIGMLSSCGYRFHAFSGAVLKPADLHDSVLPMVRFVACPPGFTPPA